MAVADSVAIDDLPAAAKEQLKMLNVKDADLRDVFRSIAHEHNLNLVVDNRINRRVTVRLSDLPVIEALTFLCEQSKLILSRTGHIFRVTLPPEPEPTPPPQPTIFVRDSLLTADLRQDSLAQVMRIIAQQSGKNIIVRQGVQGKITGALKNVPLYQGLRALMLNNGFVIREQEDIYYIDRAGIGGDEGTEGAQAFWVQATDSLVSLDVINARIADILREVAAQMKVNLVTYDTPEERITAKANNLTIDEVLNLVLKRTSVTYRQDGDMYVIGNKQTKGLETTRLIRLNHIRADAVLDLIPDMFKQSATIQIVKEHNGLVVTSTHDVISELEGFVREVDYPTPQILIEALVVDFEANDLFNLGISLGRDAQTAASEAATGVRFNGDLQVGEESGFRISGDGRQANNMLSDISSLFGLGSIAQLPADFYARIQALSVEGHANIRSRPQIATLNGYSASLTIGTTQYYLLRSQTPYQSPNQVLLQQSQRFEKIEANVTLEVKPWVSSSGEITVEIRPEFSMPVGEFDPDVPPTINSRVLESTVRLRDGETIILGGMIQDEERIFYHKVPLLGSIPLLGRLFRSTSKELVKTELVIFLTPHVFYGDERDADKWNTLRDEMDLEGLKERNTVQKVIDHIK